MSGHHHHDGTSGGDKRMAWAVAVNLLLTFAQVAGGILSGSLALIADALHNFSDAVSLLIAYAARKIARKPADAAMTFGYVRAEIVAALINYTTLIMIGLYLVYEAVMRFITPAPIEGWTIVIVAAIALVIDIVTAMLTYAMSKTSMNIRAAFLHNVADALGSVGVIVAGSLVLLYGWVWLDPAVTIAIAAYVLYQAVTEIGGSIRILMMGAPVEVDVAGLLRDLNDVGGIGNVHDLHVFAIDEEHRALEVHVVMQGSSAADAAGIRQAVRDLAEERHGIVHCTIEIETEADRCDKDAQAIGHSVRSARV
ncbi:cation diffusion facilitator family transporter [Sinorhizobium sp. 7-81]|uniref:cation diffusion facilitator family transporter n=1 Tax=Sinorhizobium sp. 8-89 TaxID=3049089 RepID=UPI0024C2A29D|nr:cation diffusion facilitator family transporter [Sinorhizobium sp. 8-89]MDK1489746.1 cation diffusion facilitator family transporter [Sinorhizobium sp. 8-89]